MRVLRFFLRPGVLWLLLLTSASVYAAIGELRSRRRDEILLSTVRRLERAVRIVAENIGEPVDVLKAQLLEVLKR